MMKMKIKKMKKEMIVMMKMMMMEMFMRMKMMVKKKLLSKTENKKMKLYVQDVKLLKTLVQKYPHKRTNCASARCSCRKSSLKCNELCKFCHGDTCNNSINAGVDTNEDSEYETHTKANDKDEETPTEEENEGSSTVRDSSPLDEIYINFEKF
ncbi:uncharacterized protein LOC123684165 [Harmonia axyridis]|uniref:uncharacterized protein LOC123680665 n=1 Tax=Harmonia axyridis TaxID=115357 RepID=UPI001E278D37|nr:uncharacterized protein LOC123680665 [Harmonia axyridis]XP_045479278.1 uncharacterized protein LOC123684165 [Harmonia axyridis]